MPGTTDMVSHFIVSPLLQRFPDASGDGIQSFFPGNAFPVTLSALSDPLHRIQYAIRIRDLIDRGRPLGAVPATASRVIRIAFEFPDRPLFLVHIGRQPARTFAVEACGGHNGIRALVLFGPAFSLVFFPVIPLLHRWKPVE